MDAIRLVIPSALLLAMFGAFFGVVLARVIWADDATRAEKREAECKRIEEGYRRIHDTDRKTIDTLQSTIDLLRSGRLKG